LNFYVYLDELQRDRALYTVDPVVFDVSELSYVTFAVNVKITVFWYVTPCSLSAEPLGPKMELSAHPKRQHVFVKVHGVTHRKTVIVKMSRS
jgi:hypothetical protein